MRVLHVFKTYLPDSFTGVERVIWQLCEGAAQRGVESHVLCLSEHASAGPIPIGRHMVHQARTTIDFASSPFSLSAFSRFNALQRDADIVHYHFPWPMMDLLHLTARRSRPSIVTYHSDIVRQARLLKLYQPVMSRFLRSVDRIVATSPNYAATSAVLAAYRPKLSVIPIGLDPVQDAPDAALVKRWQERLPGRFFLFVGALRYYKGLTFLIEAARLSGLPVVVAGAGALSDLTDSVPANVHAVGAVSDAEKQALLSMCEAFVFPSHLRSEAFGVALLEAAFAGKAMISCEIGTGTSYVNLDRVTGLVVPPADPQALADAMKMLWQQPLLAKAFGDAARTRAQTVFSAAAMVESYMKLYAETIAAT